MSSPTSAGKFQLRNEWGFPLFLFWWDIYIYILTFLEGCVIMAYKTSNSRENICLIHIPLGCQVEGSRGVATKEALIIRITSAADNVTPWPWKMAERPTTLLVVGGFFFTKFHLKPYAIRQNGWIFFLPRKGKGVKIEKKYLSCHHLQKMGLHSLKLTTNGPENRPVPKRKWSSSKHQFPGANS